MYLGYKEKRGIKCINAELQSHICCGWWGGSLPLNVRTPHVSFGEADLFPVWEQTSIVSHHSTLVRGSSGHAVHGLDGIESLLLWAKALILPS